MKLPGFIDSHLHVLGIGYFQSIVDLSKVTSIKELKQILNRKLDQAIIIGRGWNQDQLQEQRMPSKDDLNEVSKDIPIMLTRACGHVLVANDKMMTLAGISHSTEQEEGGSFDFVTGVFSENAMLLIYDKMPKPTKAEIQKYFIAANRILLENGITSVASDDFSTLNVDYEVIINILKELYEKNLMQVRITEQVNLPLDKLKDFIKKGYVNKIIHPKFKMGPLKILSDGSLGGRTAAMIEAYSDDLNNKGIKTYTDKGLFDLIYLADQEGMDTVVHAIGDAASLQAIKAIEKSMELTKRFSHHHAIIHAQLTTLDQVKQMKKLNIGAIVQPIFMNSDILIIEKRVGSRKDKVYIYKTMSNLINVGFSTDAPIEPVNPFLNIYTAISNKSLKYPTIESFNPKELFNLDEALQAYTRHNMPYVYDDQLHPGDYIIINEELSHENPDKLKDIKVLKTYIDNQEVFSLKNK